MTGTESRPPARPQGQNPRGRRVSFPETLTVGLSAGWLGRLTRAAEHDGMSRAEYVRAALRRALDASRKRGAK